MLVEFKREANSLKSDLTGDLLPRDLLARDVPRDRPQNRR
jgi:hypothetical protein